MELIAQLVAFTLILEDPHSSYYAAHRRGANRHRRRTGFFMFHINILVIGVCMIPTCGAVSHAWYVY